AGGLHRGDGVWNRGANARVIAAIEPVDRSFDARHGVLVRRAAVKDERGGEVRAIGGKAERLAATPAKAGNKQFAARGRQLQRIIRDRVQVRGDLVGIQVAHGFHGLAFGEAAAAAAVRAQAGEQVRSHGDVASGGNLVGEILDPIGHTKNLADQVAAAGYITVAPDQSWARVKGEADSVQ